MMPAPDSLDQHRRELDAVFATLTAMRGYAEADYSDSARVWLAIADLRDELLAIANRVEALTRAIGSADSDAATAALRPFAGLALVVVNMEADVPEVVGNYLRTVEDVVEYVNADNLTRSAPADCVRVVETRELPAILREAARP